MTSSEVRARLAAEAEHERGQRDLAAEGISTLMKYGPEVGVRLVKVEEADRAVYSHERSRYRLELLVTAEGAANLAKALRGTQV